MKVRSRHNISCEALKAASCVETRFDEVAPGEEPQLGRDLCRSAIEMDEVEESSLRQNN